MTTNLENLNAIIDASLASNPYSSVNVEVETELRVPRDLSQVVAATYELTPTSGTNIQCRDIYFAVSDHLFLRTRDHTVDGNHHHGSRVLSANVKLPLVLPGYGAGNPSPHMIEFTWDIAEDAYEDIRQKVTPITVVEGDRRALNIDYPTERGIVIIKMAFDTITSLGEFTEVSEEEIISSELPFGKIAPFLRQIHEGYSFEDVLGFLSNQGLSRRNILTSLHIADEHTHKFISGLGVRPDELTFSIYPQLQLQNEKNTPETRRLDYHAQG